MRNITNNKKHIITETPNSKLGNVYFSQTKTSASQITEFKNRKRRVNNLVSTLDVTPNLVYESVVISPTKGIAKHKINILNPKIKFSIMTTFVLWVAFQIIVFGLFGNKGIELLEYKKLQEQISIENMKLQAAIYQIDTLEFLSEQSNSLSLKKAKVTDLSTYNVSTSVALDNR